MFRDEKDKTDKSSDNASNKRNEPNESIVIPGSHPRSAFTPPLKRKKIGEIQEGIAKAALQNQISINPQSTNDTQNQYQLFSSSNENNPIVLNNLTGPVDDKSLFKFDEEFNNILNAFDQGLTSSATEGLQTTDRDLNLEQNSAETKRAESLTVPASQVQAPSMSDLYSQIVDFYNFTFKPRFQSIVESSKCEISPRTLEKTPFLKVKDNEELKQALSNQENILKIESFLFTMDNRITQVTIKSGDNNICDYIKSKVSRPGFRSATGIFSCKDGSFYVNDLQKYNAWKSSSPEKKTKPSQPKK